VGTKHRGTDVEVRALDALIALTRAANAVTASLHGRGTHGPLTASQFGVLEALHHLGPMSQRALAGKILKSSGNLVTVIDNLERRGLVRRRKLDSDRRVAEVSLTGEGRRVIETLFPAHVAAVVDAFSALSGDEQAELRRLCRKVGLAQ
jgi:MarR family 2-MHQ and catechol resistance regulon transcriptional repressor